MKTPLLPSVFALGFLVLHAPAWAWEGRAGHHHGRNYSTTHYEYRSHRSSETAALVAGGLLLGAALAEARPRVVTSSYYHYSPSYSNRYSTTTYYPSSRVTYSSYYSRPAPIYQESPRPRSDTTRCYEVFYRNGVRVERELPGEDCY